MIIFNHKIGTWGVRDKELLYIWRSFFVAGDYQLNARLDL